MGRDCAICHRPTLTYEFPPDIYVCRECELPRHGQLEDDLTPELFIERSGWRLASTMLNIPHQYTVRDLRTADGHQTTAMGHAEFEWFAQLTLDKGTRKRWGRYNNSYLTIGEWEYWTMGNPAHMTTIINRQAVGPNAKALIYEQVSQKLREKRGH